MEFLNFFPKEYNFSFEQFNYIDLENKILLMSKSDFNENIGIENQSYLKELLDKKNLLKKFDHIIDG